jgi:hypothetical protein
MKVCSKCGVEKGEEDFPKDRRVKSGLAARCKTCDLSYYYRNKERYLQVRKEYASGNKLIVNKVKRKWAHRNKEKIIQKERKLRNSLSNCYINNKLKRKGFTNEMLNKNPEIVQFQRIIIKTKRLCQKLQTSKS